MLAAVKGVIKGNTVVIEDDVRNYEGQDVIVTILDYPIRKKNENIIDWDSFLVPSERGNNVDDYMREMRENDRF